MKDFDKLIKELDEIIDSEMKRLFSSEKQERIGKLLFLFKDTYGLTESSMFQALDQFIETKRKEVTSKIVRLFLKSDLTTIGESNHPS